MVLAAQTHIWSDHEEQTLRRLWSQGATLNQIGSRVGVSRTAAQGKAKRLQLPPRSMFDRIPALAKAIAAGDLEIPADAARWPEDQWLDLIGCIQSAQAKGQLARAALPATCDNDNSAGPRYSGGAFRPGQTEFRSAVLGNYRHACCMTNCREPGAIEAAHIIPFSVRAQHNVSNGLALRSDLHRLFDAGLVTIDRAAKTIVVSRRVTCPQYRALQGGATSIETVRAPPNDDALAWHHRNVFTP